MELRNNESSLKRRFSLEDNFMNHKNGNDLFYGLMLHQATYDPNSNQMYLTHAKYRELRPVLKSCLAEGSTAKTFQNTLLKLMEAGLIKEGVINIGSHKNVPCYIFPADANERYQLVNCDILWYILMTRQSCAVRIYLYLYNKYLWKKRTNDDTPYEFTIKELKCALGWSATTKTCDELISVNLRSLAREGIIKYKETYVCNLYDVTVNVKQLLFVATSEAQLVPYEGEIEYISGHNGLETISDN